MADYHIDMAFDWDSNPKGGFDGYLQVGPVSVANGQGSDAALTDLKPGDTFEFYLFDITTQTAPTEVAVPANASWIAFSAANTDTSGSSPFATNATQNAVVATAGTGNSTVFGNGLPAWVINANGNQILSARVTANSGDFFYTVQFDITRGGVTKRFGVDPEMIVQPDK